MWFRKTNKNRRLGTRGLLLDVKLRSDQVRATRVRWGMIALTVSACTVFGLYVLWRTGEWALNHFLYENKEFAVQQVDAQTDGVIAADQLRRWAGVKPGENLFALDLARVKRDLELVPAIKSAAVERVLPRTLRIQVTEREPLAQVYTPQLRADRRGYDMRLLQMDADGCLMLPLEPRQRATPPAQPADSLPTLAGLDPNDLAPGRKLESPQVRAALELIVAFERSPMAGLADLRRIDVSSTTVLQAQTGQGSTVIFSATGFDKQLRRWREIFDRGRAMNLAIASVDLAVPNNVPVRWLDASAVAPLAPKAKPASNRKRNV
jgi:hypothetical protein